MCVCVRKPGVVGRVCRCVGVMKPPAQGSSTEMKQGRSSGGLGVVELLWPFSVTRLQLFFFFFCSLPAEDAEQRSVQFWKSQQRRSQFSVLLPSSSLYHTVTDESAHTHARARTHSVYECRRWGGDFGNCLLSVQLLM